MSQLDAFERILASLYDAMLDDSRWPATSALIDEACGILGNGLLINEGPKEDLRAFIVGLYYRGQRREDLEREYLKVYYPNDERIPRVRQLPDSHLVHIKDLYTAEELKTSPTYNELLLRAKHQDSLNVRLDGPDGSHIGWALGDSVSPDGWGSSQIAMIRRLLPHIRQFVRVRYALVQAKVHGKSLGALRDNNRIGFIQLDRGRRIGETNDLALALLRQGDALFDEDGMLRARLPQDNETLQQLVGRAIPPYPVQSAGGSMTVTRLKEITPLALHVSPVETPQTDFRPQRVAAFVLIMDPLRKARVGPKLVAATFGLTPTESEVAVMLAKGLTLREIAKVSGCERNTIRWHVWNICGKLGVTRQFEVARLVLSLSDLPQSVLKP